MPQYRYIGAGPDIEPVSGTLVHPGDVWQFSEEPVFGRWELVSTGKSSEKPSEASDSSPARSHADEAGNAPTGEPEPSSTKEA